MPTPGIKGNKQARVAAEVGLSTLRDLRGLWQGLETGRGEKESHASVVFSMNKASWAPFHLPTASTALTHYPVTNAHGWLSLPNNMSPEEPVNVQF